MLQKLLLLSVFFMAICYQNTFAQKTTTQQQLIWVAYNNDLKINEKWSLNSDVQERRFYNPAAQHQFLILETLNRILEGGWTIGVGACAFWQSPQEPTATQKLVVPELRPHVEFNLKQKTKKLAIDHRYKFEGRFFHNTNTDHTALDKGYDFGNFRLRYRIQVAYPLWQFKNGKMLKIKANDEVLCNAGKNIVKNVFDQNRIYAALSFDILKNLSIEAGYLNWYQQRTSGSDFYNRHIIRFGISQKLSLRSKTIHS